MENINQKLANNVLNILFFFAVIVAVLGFIVDFKNTLKYGGVDLRNRVVAARLLIDGIDPYYFKWHQGMSDLLLDPGANPSWPVSRATIPPTVLMLHALIAKLSYMKQKIIFFVFQWGLLLSSLAIFAKSANSKIKIKLIWVIGLLFFSGSYFWRLHVERGQIYIFYAFLISSAYWLTQKSFKYNYVLSGFLIGLTASLRPPVVLMFIPMLIYKQWKLLIGSITGLLSGLFVSFSFAGISIWKKYFSAMKVWENVHSGFIEFNGGNWVNFNAAYPNQIEGMSNLTSTLGVPGAGTDTSFQYIFNKLGIKLYPNILLLLLFITLLVICFFIYKNRSSNDPRDLFFLSGTLFVLIGEHFLPAIRSSYNDIQWLVPLLLIIVTSDIFMFLSNRLNIILLISLFFSIGFTWMPYMEYISDMMMLLYTVFMLLFLAGLNNIAFFSWIEGSNRSGETS